MKLTSLLIFFLLLSKNVFAEKIFNAKSFELRNGLKVIVIENKRAPVVAQMIWYNFGSGIEENGKSGLAHFMEHLMFKGTKNFQIVLILTISQRLAEVKTHLQATIIRLIIKYFLNMNLRKLCKWSQIEWLT